mgnify:CR=1 FL=1
MKLAISVAKPHVASVKSYVESVGQCTAFQQISLVPQVEGTLVKVAYPNGGQVKKGDLLFQIDDDSFKAYLKQSEAQLAMDEARHQLNVLQLKRSEGLRSGNFVSQQEYDTYKANVDDCRESPTLRLLRQHAPDFGAKWLRNTPPALRPRY